MKTFTKGTMTLVLLASIIMPRVSQAMPIAFHKISMEVRSSTYWADGTESPDDALATFYSGELLCSLQLRELDAASGNSLCGAGPYDQATLFSLEYSLDQSFTGQINFEFGTDWGRGGMVFDSTGNVEHYLGDIWWGYNWAHHEVISFSLPTEDSTGTLWLLGFEGCCVGNTSLRVSVDGVDEWQIAEVPEPETLLLLGLGLAGMGLARRKKKS